ncbi:hypothetical protein SAMN05428964_105356 [Thalassospira xiamenensis]|uniref:Uncharacterized protein n=2 Tax=Thalassospira xiamenensis TaxID=220697 RepID=A0A285TT85_9PROT|nr:hypothetical protein SAMN05428964_105356 [Thalassospira xiamenensis]
MARISINGVTIEGNNLSIRNGQVTIDGRAMSEIDVEGILSIRVEEGTIQELRTDLSVSCNDVSGNVSAGGSVNCDDVGGNVSAGGSVNCDDVSGNVSAGGAVNADKVKGQIL